MTNKPVMRLVPPHQPAGPADDERLDAVFFALSDPTRRRILERLETESLLVSELAAPFELTLQGVSRHIQVLVRAGLIQQERTGRINRCSLDVGPMFDTAVWINRYTKYWQTQFNALAAALEESGSEPPKRAKPARAKRRKPKRSR